MARGGKRDGAGRKVGVPSAKTIKRREVVDKAAAQGKDPIDVMLENMRHFHQVALGAEAVLEQFADQQRAEVKADPEEQFKAMLAEVKKAAGLRQIAQECARDAAPYIHAKLSSIDTNIKAKLDGSITFTWLPPQS